MPADSYSRMELIRLSTATGKVLNRLNLLQGQILHGKIFKMEPFSTGGKSGQEVGIGTSGGVARIVLGSQLIEAVVNKLLPEGASIKLEVIQLGEDKFTLRLLAVDGILTGSQNVATISDLPDTVDWTTETRQAIENSQARTLETPGFQTQTRIVDLPNLSELPETAARMLKAAISEGFIEPAQFTAKIPEIQTSLQKAISQLEGSIRTITEASPQAVQEIARSINALIKILRPIVARLPSQYVPLNDSVTLVSQALKNAAYVLRPSNEPGSLVTYSFPGQPRQGPTSGTPQAGPMVTTTAQSTGSAPSQPASVTGSGFSTPQAQSGSAGTTPQPQQAPQAGQISETGPGQPAPATQAPGNVAGTSGTAASTNVPGTVNAQLPTPATPSAPDAVGDIGTRQSTQHPDAESPKAVKAALPEIMAKRTSEDISQGRDARAEQAQHARNVLLGIRTLSLLSSRIAQARGWNIHESATFVNHASHLTTLADAYEGVLLAPLLTSAFETPDAIPRLLLSLLFPGGYGEVGIIQPDGTRPDESGSEDSDSDDRRNNCIGLIRLRTEGLGNLNVKLDFHGDAENEIPPRVSGTFHVEEFAADILRTEIPALDRALDARGIISDGFNVRETGIGRQAPQTGIPARRTDTSGGLDIKV